MANILIDRVDGLSAEEVMHAQTSALGPQTTVGEARAYFAASTSRRMAVLTDAGRYLGALTPSGLPAEGDDDRLLLEVLGPRPTVGPSVPAATARELALLLDLGAGVADRLRRPLGRARVEAVALAEAIGVGRDDLDVQRRDAELVRADLGVLPFLAVRIRRQAENPFARRMNPNEY